MKFKTILCSALWLLPALLLGHAEQISPVVKVVAPAPVREFRAAWIATVANIDWPSKPGLPAAQQQAEMLSLLDRAAQLHFNAVFLQVRSVADAIYPSSIEPWSEYLTGIQGRAPQSLYDPLAFAITEAHKRGLALHAWFNPFRAGHPEAKSPPAANHVTRTHPELVRHYGQETWLDPGEPMAQSRALAVVLDVVKRYDVDGVVFDDYFYPYPVKNGSGRLLDFPDEPSWKKRTGATANYSRDDWRRENINQFVQKMSQSIHAAKPRMQFGISPFGIWRPAVPTGIDPKALDAYGKLYADARLWLANGWLDFLAPQLYWPIAEREHSFPTLLDWWRTQNIRNHHVWPALYDAVVGTRFSTDEIPRQIQVTRQKVDSGQVHYHLRSVLDNPTLAAAVQAQYASSALVPASPWLNVTAPPPPKLTVTIWKKYAQAEWQVPAGVAVGNWVFQIRANSAWTTRIFPPGVTACNFAGVNPDAIVIRVADRLGNLSEAAVWPATGRGAMK